jgi:nucleotide-binding universal stress UspA family protein
VITRILAPVDGCEQSEAVLPYVEELSDRLSAHVTLLHVFPTTLHEQREAHMRYVETLAAQLRERLRHSGVDVVAVAMEGTPNQEIADYAARDEIGLIAAAPHSQSSGGHWNVGRTTDKVIRQTTKPVLLVAADHMSDVPRNSLMSRILVPLDGSRASREVLPHVEAVLRRDWNEGDSMVCLLHVIPAEHYAAGPIIAKRVPYEKEESDALQAQASRYLEEVAAKLRARGRSVLTHVAVGDAASMILSTSAEIGANLIAMTTHGYSGFSRLFLGSVAERVLHHSSVPLLLVKPERY